MADEQAKLPHQPSPFYLHPSDNSGSTLISYVLTIDYLGESYEKSVKGEEQIRICGGHNHQTDADRPKLPKVGIMQQYGCILDLQRTGEDTLE